ncbi:GAS2-like protein 2A isoform X1 [Stegostoma tigrinum]|uniref:GAS2-like protein 2A isoform X1 n=2 Tax=Stegostoma tigrinum TaxID=3053191 RepID=UPI00202B372C|nr:GAS2-like protein 2A isoform X1 [Stegostoma tigrinum]
MANAHNIQSATAKSIRPFKSSGEYLLAMKEDLAEWLHELYGLRVSAQGLLEALQTGWLLCTHANNVTRVAKDFSREYPQLLSRLKLPQAGVTYTTSAQPGTFQARDNVSNFINWCRKELEIQDVLMFETEDLVLRKNEKNFVLCLLEVARRASKFGMLAPVLIQMEEQIEEEIREEMDLPSEIIPPKPKPQKELCDFRNLDEMVRYLVSRCTCPDQFPMVKVSEGKYKVGDSNTLIFVRILRSHVMVRVGGGWDTLEHYLDKHDPCRCTSLTHKQVSRFSSPHRAVNPVHEIKTRLPPRTDQTNKPQTALILSRSQSPMPPVEWRLNTPPAVSTRSRSAVRPPSPDVHTSSGGHSTMRTPRDKSEPRQSLHTRQKDRPATPSYQMSVNIESIKPNSSTTTAARTGRERSRTLPASSKCPAAQESKCTVVPTMDAKKVPSQLIAPRRSDAGLNQTWTSAQFAESKVNQSNSNEGKHRTSAVSQKPPSEMTPRASKGLARSYSPAPGRVSKLSLVQDAERKGDKSQVCQRHLSPAGAWQESCGQEPKLVSKPLNDREKNAQQQCRIRSQTPEPYSINNNNNKGVNSDMRELCTFTPPPINPTQESALYKSLEDEIASNMKALQVGLYEDNAEITELHTFASVSSLSSCSKCKKPDSPVSSKCSVSSFPSPCDNTDRPYSCINVASIQTRGVTENGSSFNAVLTELVSGTQKLNRVDIENWIAKSPNMLLAESCTNLQTAALNSVEPTMPLPNRTEVQSEHYTKTGSKSVQCNQENNDFEGTNLNSAKSHITPAQNNLNTIEVDSRSTNEGSDTNSSLEWPHPPCAVQKARAQQERQKRSLRKPERVPSIYKLKLRPKIRPRRDNRPEKKPSRIPTPLSYREADKTVKGLTKSGSSHKSHRANSKASKSKVQGRQISALCFMKAEEGLGLGEDFWVCRHSVSPGDRTAVQQAMIEDSGQREEDEESWV